MNIETIVLAIMNHFLPTATGLGALALLYWLVRALAGPRSRQGESTAPRRPGRALAAGLALAPALGLWFLLYNVELPLPPTQFSEGYSRFAFNRLRLNDTADSIHERLGEPLATFPETPDGTGEVQLIYSRPAGERHNQDYWRRAVVVDTETNRITRKISSFVWTL